MNFIGNSNVLIQGMMEPAGRVYAPLMKAYGTSIVAGVSPGQGGETYHDIPMFDLVEQALETVGMVDTAVIFVPPYQVMDAALEAIAAGIRQIVLITEGVPPLDMIRLIRKAESTETLVVGPNSPGLIVPEQLLIGTLAAQFYTPGSVGLVSRCGTLTDEVARQLTQAGIGQSIVVGIGGDRIVGSSFQQWLQILEEDDQTDVIVLVGEIGGDSEEAAARYILEAIDKPVVAYIAGRTVPNGQLLGHAGVIIASQVTDLGLNIGTADSKIAAFKRAKVAIADTPAKIPELVKKALKTVKKVLPSG